MSQLALDLRHRLRYPNITRADMYASNAFWQSTPLPIVIQMAATIRNDWGQEEPRPARPGKFESPGVT